MFKKNRFFVRLQDAIVNNGMESIGIVGQKGSGKSTLATQIMKRIYGSYDLAREFRITRRDELPALIEKVREDSRYWIPYSDGYLKRVPAINWDDIAVDMPSTEGNQKDFIIWHKYFQTIRSHVAVMLGTFPDWSDFRRRMKIAFTGEIVIHFQTRRLIDGRIIKNVKRKCYGFAIFLTTRNDMSTLRARNERSQSHGLIYPKRHWLQRLTKGHILLIDCC